MYIEKKGSFEGYTNGEPNPKMGKTLLNKSQKTLEVAEICYMEGYYNNCVSRSYYGIYQLLTTILVREGKYVKKSRTHEKVIGDFNKEYGKDDLVRDYDTFFNDEILKEENKHLLNNKEFLLLKKERLTVGSHVNILRLYRRYSDYEPIIYNSDFAEALLYLTKVLAKYIKQKFKISEGF